MVVEYCLLGPLMLIGACCTLGMAVSFIGVLLPIFGDETAPRVVMVIESKEQQG